MFFYETHLHTSQASACASVTGAYHARQYKEQGYDGIIITDHFFGGNTSVPSRLSWEERVNRFCDGYEDAKREGDRIGLKVFFGWEQAYYGETEFLIYGMDKEWLLAHPEMEEWSIEEQFAQVDAAGGLVVQAHPFRNRYYISKIRLYPNHAHAIEGVNAGNTVLDNQLALAYGKEYGLTMTGGSDCHGKENLGGGTCFEKKLYSIEDYIREVKAGRVAGIAPMPPNKKKLSKKDIVLPVKLYI